MNYTLFLSKTGLAHPNCLASIARIRRIGSGGRTPSTKSSLQLELPEKPTVDRFFVVHLELVVCLRASNQFGCDELVTLAR